MEQRIPTLIYSEDKNMKVLIQKQGCRDENSKDILEDAIHRFDYGFVFTIPKAQIGQRRARIEDRLNVGGFVLMEERDRDELHIHLICVESQHKGDGAILMKHVIEFAKGNEYLIITLNSLPEKQLVKWYEEFGFKVMVPVYDKKNEIKVYKMYLQM